MATTVTFDGLDWISEKTTGDLSDEWLYVIAVGDGTRSPSQDDQALQSELYRANDDDSNCSIGTTSDTGEIAGRITITGGQEVPSGREITEFGMFTRISDILVYREVRTNGVTLESGDRKTFEFEFTYRD